MFVGFLAAIMAIGMFFLLRSTGGIELDHRRMMSPRRRARERRIQEVGTGLCFVLLVVLVLGAGVWHGCGR